MSSESPRPILASDVLDHLRDRHIAIGAGASVTPLEEGVSARVYLVEDGDTRLVVKQALPELNVAGLWAADPARALTEARALELTGSMIPESVPHLLDVDPELCAITMSAANAAWSNWRTTLLSPPRDETRDEAIEGMRRIAAGLGKRIGRVHQSTWGDMLLRHSFDDDLAFEQLRVDPYHRTVALRHPDAAPSIAACIDELFVMRECLVHGDFSPKNILHGRSHMWILDFEVARFGASVFDLAFLGHHLALKAIVNPDYALAYRNAFDAFLTSYRAVQPVDAGQSLLGWHTATLLLARVDGLSPAAYLADAQREIVRALALELLASPTSIDLLWDLVATAGSRSFTS